MMNLHKMRIVAPFEHKRQIAKGHPAATTIVYKFFEKYPDQKYSDWLIENEMIGEKLDKFFTNVCHGRTNLMAKVIQGHIDLNGGQK